jgi:hypothetical protein
MTHTLYNTMSTPSSSSSSSSSSSLFGRAEGATTAAGAGGEDSLAGGATAPSLAFFVSDGGAGAGALAAGAGAVCTQASTHRSPGGADCLLVACGLAEAERAGTPAHLYPCNHLLQRLAVSGRRGVESGDVRREGCMQHRPCAPIAAPQQLVSAHQARGSPHHPGSPPRQRS